MSYRHTQYLSIDDAKAVEKWPVGTLVRLKVDESEGLLHDEDDRPVARVTSYIPGIKGGVIVSPKLEDMRAWNIDALEKMR